MLHAHGFQGVILEVALHSEHLRYGVADRGSSGENHSFVIRNFIQILRLAEHIGGFLRVRGGKTGHILHFCN